MTDDERRLSILALEGDDSTTTAEMLRDRIEGQDERYGMAMD